MDYNLLTDEILVKLLRADDEQAFKQIYLKHWQPLFNGAYHRLGNKEVAKELVQNLFMRLWEKRRESIINHLPNYLNTAIKNSVINYIESVIIQKKYFHHTKTTGYGQAALADNVANFNELNNAIEKAANLLPEKTRHVFQLSRFENLSVREIATSLNISEKAVEYHITQSLKFLRLHLKEYLVYDLILLSNLLS
jgi:RNA polymerase sigma-70 factor (family 1)